MFLSTFDIFKIGIGPSSSHTMGPMVAAGMFLDDLRKSHFTPAGLRASLHGSLAFTGKGHATDRAVALGLSGFLPDTYDLNEAERALEKLADAKTIRVDGLPPMKFDPVNDLVFDYEIRLPRHANGMILFATDAQDDVILQETYYSIGGGFVRTEGDYTKISEPVAEVDFPYPFENAAEMLQMAGESGKSIGDMMLANERRLRSSPEIDEGVKRIWDVMNRCIERGLETGGVLPGGLGIKRRSKAIMDRLKQEHGTNIAAPHIINDWISVYAMAVNEENANGGQVVTSPTNGAAGVIPATLKYFLEHVPTAWTGKIPEFFLTAAAIGGLMKKNASISGAECGCQAEVGSAAAMGAAGLCAVLGGSPSQVENAAEIALEHHLGMTCDPVKGLVQVPCIERNGLGAIKAVSAASLSLRGDGTHFVSLDACIETMRQTGEDMNEKYKETSLGGLAVNVPYC
ncbi:MAG: L-serine ammonia-lyase [Albidovulum sp.]|nr:L-serine ammonia-lyase [Albidovulum sp.]MDE0531686.1 L-serine ammonia-lyase [Albidovulum sp.]